MAKAEATNGLLLMGPEETRLNAEFETRVYQETLAEMSKSKNVIVNLPTGSGKTLIAMKVAAHFASIMSKDEKIFFLAPTVPLVNQQGNKFKQYLLTEIVTGGKALTRVQSPETFLIMTSNIKVIACIPDVFLRWLQSGLVSPKIIRLLIVDECHNAAKNSPMSRAMDFINRAKTWEPNSNLRILGLTATLTKKNIRLSEVDLAIQALERKMNCVALTYDDYEEVLKFSTNADIETVPYSLEKDPSADEMREVNDVFITLETAKQQWSFNNTSHKPDSAFIDNLFKILQDVIGIFKEYGLLGAIVCAYHKLQYIQELRTKPPYSLQKGEYEIEKTLFDCVYTALEILYREGRSKFNASNSKEANFLDLWISRKALAVLKILKKYSNVEDLNALLFCQTQVSAYTLKELVNVLSQSLPLEYGFIKPTVLIGHNNKAQVRIAERITQRKQVKILESFRQKQFNLIVCTSILEEGVDLQACNVVIRVDPVHSYASVIQSMGRARKFKAKFYALAKVADNESTGAKMGDYKQLQSVMTKALVNKMKETKSEMGSPKSYTNYKTDANQNETYAKVHFYPKFELDDVGEDEMEDSEFDWY